MSNSSTPVVITHRRSRTAVALRRLRLRFRLLPRDVGPFVRRALDLVLSASSLLLLLPLAIVVAAAVKLNSRGPILYSQVRVGRLGRPFRLFKVRTMVTNADSLVGALATAHQALDGGVRFKMQRDPRITRVGRLLRKLSIDELPQLWNVLVGDMTLVGPRPALPREVARYDARALRRLAVRPGLTCLWQINGRSDLSFEQQVELDLHYIDRVGPWQELGIVLRTIPAVLTGRGAY